jgi:outer membrane protein OmpA-like peptidoglycan-associated protein
MNRPNSWSERVMRGSTSLIVLAFHVIAGGTVCASEERVTIPLRESLTVVTAVNDEDRGDYESIKRITAVTPEAIRLHYSADIGEDGERVSGTRNISRNDLQNAREYHQVFRAGEERFPGTTAIGTSTAVLNELKANGRAEFSCQSQAAALLGGLTSLVAGLFGDEADNPLGEVTKLQGKLTRVGEATVPIAVLVNGISTNLPAIHAVADFEDEEAEFFFLDDPNNPLTLKFTIGDSKLQVIKITFPGDKPERRIEAELADTGRAEVYDIYFDFASDQLRPESEPVLKEIADALSGNSSWVLRVEGHTDSIGGASSNLDLSKRRAASVKQALVGQFGIDPGRLNTDGFGASRPKDSNETLEGRARNRRVELVRER